MTTGTEPTLDLRTEAAPHTATGGALLAVAALLATATAAIGVGWWQVKTGNQLAVGSVGAFSVLAGVLTGALLLPRRPYSAAYPVVLATLVVFTGVVALL